MQKKISDKNDTELTKPLSKKVKVKHSGNINIFNILVTLLLVLVIAGLGFIIYKGMLFQNQLLTQVQSQEMKINDLQDLDIVAEKQKVLKITKNFKKEALLREAIFLIQLSENYYNAENNLKQALDKLDEIGVVKNEIIQEIENNITKIRKQNSNSDLKILDLISDLKFKINSLLLKNLDNNMDNIKTEKKQNQQKFSIEQKIKNSWQELKKLVKINHYDEIVKPAENIVNTKVELKEQLSILMFSFLEKDQNLYLSSINKMIKLINLNCAENDKMTKYFLDNLNTAKNLDLNIKSYDFSKILSELKQMLSAVEG